MSRGARRIAFYGAGDVGVDVFVELSNRGFSFNGAWFDGKAENTEIRIFDDTVRSPKQLTSHPCDAVVVCSVAFSDEIHDTLIELGVPKSKIIRP